MSLNLLEKSLAYINQPDQGVVDTKKLQQAHEVLSAAYRQKKGTSFFTTSEQIKAYFTVRMPATFASIYRCLSEIPFEDPPQTLLDLGAGPGTATLAVLEKWPSLKAATLVEQHGLMFDFSQKLFTFLNFSTSVHHLRADLKNTNFKEVFDLVVLGYVLGEFEKEEQLKVVEKAWGATSQFLLVVSPGTPFDYDILMHVREFLLSKGALILAPCPHQRECPLRETKDWCHFSVRLSRARAHQKIKQAALTYEDEKYSYLLFGKEPVGHSSQRVIKRPIQRSGHIIMDLCTLEGIKRETIGRKDKEIYKKALKREWGKSWSKDS
jgi:ribosomal protein RSM22 (predicted rRNA methylase)